MDYCGGKIYGAIVSRKQLHKGVVLLAAVKGRAPPKSLIKKIMNLARRLSKSHIGADSQASEGRNLKPITIRFIKENWLRELRVLVYRFWCDYGSCYHSDSRILKRFDQVI